MTKFIVPALLLSGIVLAGCTNANQTAAPANSNPPNSAPIAAWNPDQSPRPSGQRFGNLPAGDRPIFGSITAVNGNQLTVSSQRFGGGRNRNPNSTPNPTPTTTTLTVTLNSSTQYTGGTQSDLTVGTRVGGFGTPNSDGSITAQSISINPQPRGSSRPTSQ